MLPDHFDQLPTPAALVDEAKMLHNIGRMQARIAALGPRFRPHVKTSKCLEVARRQAAAGAQFGQYHALGADGALAIWERFGGW